MIEQQLKRTYNIFLFLLCMVVIACRKDANLVITTPPVIDTSAMVKHTGIFSNGPYGRVMGNVEILKQDSGFILRLKKFSSSSGPDLHVYLSKEQQPRNFIDLGSLRSRTGDQAYRVPENTDVNAYPFALIHCQAYNHLFGSARLQ